MQRFDLRTVDVDPRAPVVLDSQPEGRTVLINLPAGERLQEHEVHERAWVVVVEGEVRMETGGEDAACGPGSLTVFDPQERHDVRATSDARLLLILAPWPGDGHPSHS